MLTFVTIFHIVIAVLLIITVLIQDSKGGGAFGMGGSGSNQIMSTTNAANFLVKATRVLAGLFAVTCLSLTYISSHRSSSVTDQFAPPTSESTAPNTEKSGASKTETPAEQPAPKQ